MPRWIEIGSAKGVCNWRLKRYTILESSVFTVEQAVMKLSDLASNKQQKERIL